MDRTGPVAAQLAHDRTVDSAHIDAGGVGVLDRVALPKQIANHVSRSVGVLGPGVEARMPAAPERVVRSLEVAQCDAATEGEQIDARLPPEARRVAVAAGVLHHVAQEAVAARVRRVEAGVDRIVHVAVGHSAVARAPEEHAHAPGVGEGGAVVGRRCPAVDLAAADPDLVVAVGVVVVAHHRVVAVRDQRADLERRAARRAGERGVAAQLEDRVRAAGPRDQGRIDEDTGLDQDLLRPRVGERVHRVLEVVHLEHAVVVEVPDANPVGEAVPVAVDRDVDRVDRAAAAGAEPEPGDGPEPEEQRREG